MAKGLPRSLARGGVTAPVRRQTIKVTNAVVQVDGATGVGWGTAVIGDLPAGNILLLGAVSYMQFTGPTSASLADTYDGDYSIGSAPTADSTINGSEVDIIQSTALGAATAEVSPRARGTSAAAICGTILDNTDGSLEVNLNLLIDDANISADDLNFTASGEVHISYVVLGDD
jgi:hypothetical protein